MGFTCQSLSQLSAYCVQVLSKVAHITPLFNTTTYSCQYQVPQLASNLPAGPWQDWDSNSGQPACSVHALLMVLAALPGWLLLEAELSVASVFRTQPQYPAPPPNTHALSMAFVSPVHGLSHWRQSPGDSQGPTHPGCPCSESPLRKRGRIPEG